MKQVIVIGGGIIGLSCAFYLRKAGFKVSVIDGTDMQNSCSYGSAGYICPSHFIPLAAPGVVKQALKWMLNPKSPFYVEPRLKFDLLDWGLKFMQSSTKTHMERSAIPLKEISLLSKHLYEEWNRLPEFDFAYEQKGLLDFFKTKEAALHAEETAKKSRELGLDVELLSKSETERLEPDVEIDIAGAIHFKCDAHLYPNKLMHCLIHYLASKDVHLYGNEAAMDFLIDGNKITAVKTVENIYECDEVVLAAGAWSREIAAKLKLKIPMAGGRGYSVTLENSPYKIYHPIFLNEARVALTPMDGNKLRFGGTMEITSLEAPPNLRRVEGILESVERYFPKMMLSMPSPDKVWSGYRPCSADGLPYIGRLRKYHNLTVATGHSMLGLSLGPGTGKLVSEIIKNSQTTINIKPFNPERFN